MTDTDLESLARVALSERFPASADATLLSPSTGPSRRRLTPAFAGAAVVLLVLIVAAAIAAWPNQNSHDSTGTPASPNTNLRTHLSHLARQFATNTGSPISRVEAVRTTQTRAAQAMMGNSEPGNEAVWAIELTAETAFHPASRGDGITPYLSDRYALWVVNAHTLKTTDLGYTNQHVDLSGIGPVTTFSP